MIPLFTFCFISSNQKTCSSLPFLKRLSLTCSHSRYFPPFSPNYFLIGRVISLFSVWQLCYPASSTPFLIFKTLLCAQLSVVLIGISLCFSEQNQAAKRLTFSLKYWWPLLLMSFMSFFLIQPLSIVILLSPEHPQPQVIPPQILSPVVFSPQLQSHFSISTRGCHRYYKLKVSKVNTFSPFPISTYFPSTILFKNNNESVPLHPKQNKNNLALSSMNTHWDGAKHLKGYSFGVAESHSLDGVKVFPTIDVLQVF